MPFPCTTNLSLNGKHILKKSNLVKNVKNLKNTVKGILLFYDKMLDRKPEDPTEIFSWKVSITLMGIKVTDQLLTRSIENGLINNEKALTMIFVRDIIVDKNTFGDALSLPDGYGKEEFINTYI